MEPLASQSNNRKEKSLSLLVNNFMNLYLNMYKHDGVDLIAIDDAAQNLGVERRRIYDVVNILKSVGVVEWKGKNQYAWRGFGEVPRALDALKEAGMREKYGVVPYLNNSEEAWMRENVNNSEMVLQEAGRQEKYGIGSVTNTEMVLYDQVKEPLNLTSDDDQEISPPLKRDGKKEKGVWMLAQNFVKLFLCSEVDLITAEDITNALLNVSQDNMNMNSKIRRLYDIANVFSSLNLIEKTQCPVSKKPACRWLGFNGISTIFPVAPPTVRDCNEPRKRASGTTLGDLERLSATFRPQYYNPELHGLLEHFTQTWKTFCEHAGKK